MLYKALGIAVWKAAGWYLRRGVHRASRGRALALVAVVLALAAGGTLLARRAASDGEQLA